MISTSFQHFMAYGSFKYLTRKTVCDDCLINHINIAKNPKYHRYHDR